MKKFWLPLLLIILLPDPLAAQTPPPPTPRAPAPGDMISVSGVGKVTAAPDRVSFTVGVQTTAMNVEDAVRENNRRTAAVIAALKAAGANDQEIRTSSFSIFPQHEYQEGGRRPILVGYQVGNNVTVTRSTTADAGRLLQAAVNAGVNQASGLSLTVSDQTRHRDEGLRRAFEDARAKANVLARAAGRTVGAAISITEGGAAQPPIPYGRTVAMEAQASEVPVQPGVEELAYTVSVIFEMR
ncbi:MAG TPA: SIMPL domain-containing protein [Thermoanaerobaculia bacterium]|nr:SIMPL domain-containing protein [Thermoanaerobaculia bacterium]